MIFSGHSVGLAGSVLWACNFHAFLWKRRQKSANGSFRWTSFSLSTKHGFEINYGAFSKQGENNTRVSLNFISANSWPVQSPDQLEYSLWSDLKSMVCKKTLRKGWVTKAGTGSRSCQFPNGCRSLQGLTAGCQFHLYRSFHPRKIT